MGYCGLLITGIVLVASILVIILGRLISRTTAQSLVQ